jgi:serine protease Do
MKKILSKKAIGYIALALVCVFAGTILGSTRPAAVAEETKVIVTSPFTEAIAKVRDSVVGVNNYQIVNNNYGGYDGYDYFPWSYFGGFGNGRGNGYGNTQPESSEEVKYGSGSGVVIAKEYVLTNYHVVDGAHSLKISIDGDENNLYDATLAAFDEDKDVAVLNVPGLPLDPVELGDSDELQIGDWVVNIGNAIGFTGTATAGIVSGIDREIPGDGSTLDKYGRSTKIVNSMIQTDAAINVGNSGGGMFNIAGQLVGIPTLKYTGSRYSSNAAVESIGMCIPINEAKDVIETALNGTGNSEQGKPEEKKQDAETEVRTGLVGKPRMGITVSTLGDTGGQLPKGVLISAVEEGSPAEKAGLKVGDIMVEVNGQVITTTEEEMAIVGELKEGDEVAVKVFRSAKISEKGLPASINGEYVDLKVTLAMIDPISQ